MARNYSIEKTTRVEREKITINALALSTLDAQPPSKETMSLVNEYIEGKREIQDILKDTIKRYKKM